MTAICRTACIQAMHLMSMQSSLSEWQQSLHVKACSYCDVENPTGIQLDSCAHNGSVLLRREDSSLTAAHVKGACDVIQV